MITKSYDVSVGEVMEVTVNRHENGNRASVTLSVRAGNSALQTFISLDVESAVQIGNALIMCYIQEGETK